MVNIIDKTIEVLSPEAALRRDTARKVLKAQRAYEAAQPSRLRKIKTDSGSGDASLGNNQRHCHYFLATAFHQQQCPRRHWLRIAGPAKRRFSRIPGNG